MQDILLSYLDTHGGQHCSVTEEQFGLLLERATGKEVGAAEIKRIFDVFDHDKDGKLDYSDCII
jgi:Ca2+-binding EF-hand superfamily protein